MIARRRTFLVIALTLCLALVAGSATASFAAGSRDASVAKKKKCKKGTKLKKKKCVPTKKKAAKPKATAGVPADGIYAGDKINVNVATKAGKRFVTVSASIPLTCAPSNMTSTRTLSVHNMPLAGTSFQGKAFDPQFAEFGTTTITGTFLSATRVHVTAQSANYKNGQEDCNGSLDVTTNIRKGY